MNPFTRLQALAEANPEVSTMMSSFAELDYIYRASLEAMGQLATPIQTTLSCENVVISFSDSPVYSSTE